MLTERALRKVRMDEQHLRELCDVQEKLLDELPSDSNSAQDVETLVAFATKQKPYIRRAIIDTLDDYHDTLVRLSGRLP